MDHSTVALDMHLVPFVLLDSRSFVLRKPETQHHAARRIGFHLNDTTAPGYTTDYRDSLAASSVCRQVPVEPGALAPTGEA